MAEMRDVILGKEEISMGLFFRESFEEALEEILDIFGLQTLPGMGGYSFEALFGGTPQRKKIYSLNVGFRVKPGDRSIWGDARHISIDYSPQNPVLRRDVYRISCIHVNTRFYATGGVETKVSADKYSCYALEGNWFRHPLNLPRALEDSGFDLSPLLEGDESAYIECKRYASVPDALVFYCESRERGTYIMQRGTGDIRKISNEGFRFQEEITEALKRAGYNTRRKDCMDVALMGGI